VVPIRTATNTALKAITVGTYPGAIAITPNGKTAYILNAVFEPGTFPGTVIPLRIATGTLGKPITVGSGPGLIVFAP
jgi:DNA-binding beta-propeller fold protein YncE